ICTSMKGLCLGWETLEPHLDLIGFCFVLCRPFFDVRHILVPIACCRSHALHGTRLGSSRTDSDTRSLQREESLQTLNRQTQRKVERRMAELRCCVVLANVGTC